jgi:hypothetical protein
MTTCQPFVHHISISVFVCYVIKYVVRHNIQILYKMMQAEGLVTCHDVVGLSTDGMKDSKNVWKLHELVRLIQILCD